MWNVVHNYVCPWSRSLASAVANALLFITCEGCCKGDVSSISCNESTLHTSNISPTEICLLVAMVLMGVSLIV